MTIYRKLVLFIVTICLSMVGATAQTDVTYLITNPDFEDGVTGWKTAGIGPQGNSSFSLKHGTTYAETWTSRGSKLRDTQLLQTLTNLPPGVYTLTAAAQNIQEDSPTREQKGAYLCANDNKTPITVRGEYSVTATTGDGTLTIGVMLRGCTGNWFAVDNFRMTYTVVADSLQPYIKTLLDEAAAVVAAATVPEDSPARQELDAATTQLKTYVGNQQTEGLVEAIERLKRAILAFRLYMASPENPFDMTSAIVNPSFEESGTKGWTAVDLGPQGNDSFTLKAGSTYLEKWTWRGNAVGDGSVRQIVTDLPSGNYRLSCAAQNIQEDSPTAAKNGACIFAGEKQTKVTKRARYSVDFTCITGEVEIGFEAKNAQGNWIAVDDFQLLFLGASEEANLAQLQERIEMAEGLAEEHLNADTLAVLNEAIAAAKAYSSGQELTPIANALNNAIAKAEGSITAYRQLAAAIEAAVKALGGFDDTAAERATLEAAIAAAQDTFDDLHQSNEALAAASAVLERAVLVFQLANPTGTVPKVTTHPEVIYGCKAAVGRLKVTGSNILERGFCWSTQPEPTVLDNKSTTYYNFNGQVFLMSDLQPSTTYYVRAYAMTKQYAVGYGEVVRIITLPEADVVYSYNWAADDATNERINNACKTAVDYLNTWTAIRGFRPSVNYDAGEDGAHGGYGGWITLGPGFTQNPGTVMHEMGHGIGVGQHWRYTSWDSPLHPTMYWTGERANRVFAFFENQADVLNADGTFASGGNHTVADGDRVHVCYGLSGVTAPIDLLRQAAFYQGMYEDGLPAVGDGACPFYSFDCVEGMKYYITNERNGIGQCFLKELSAGKLCYMTADLSEIILNDSYAWYVSYEPRTGFYHIRNAQSGNVLSYKSSAFVTREAATLLAADDIHLMPSRQTATFTVNGVATTVKPYWIARGNRVENPPVLTAASGTSVTAPQLNFYDTATQQRWAFLSAELVGQLADGIEVNESSMSDADRSDSAVFDLSGRRIANGNLRRGLYIADGKKIIVH